MPVEFTQVIPMLRIFSVEKARDFYLHFLGFKLDWENDGGGRSPMYMQVSRGDLVLHLTEHYGDCTPGSSVFVTMEGVEEFIATSVPADTSTCIRGSEGPRGMPRSWKSLIHSAIASGSMNT